MQRSNSGSHTVVSSIHVFYFTILCDNLPHYPHSFIFNFHSSSYITIQYNKLFFTFNIFSHPTLTNQTRWTPHLPFTVDFPPPPTAYSAPSTSPLPPPPPPPAMSSPKLNFSTGPPTAPNLKINNVHHLNRRSLPVIGVLIYLKTPAYLLSYQAPTTAVVTRRCSVVNLPFHLPE